MGLTLTRKVGERIRVGDDIVIDVRRIGGVRVHLSIEAPAEVKILRGELWDQDQREKESRGE